MCMNLCYSHYCISVNELERAMKFYELFGFKEERRFVREELGVEILYMVNEQALKLELLHPQNPILEKKTRRTFEENIHYVGYQHVGFTTQNIDEAYEKLKKTDVPLAGDIKTGKISKYFFCWDPDGNLIEVIQYFHQNR